MENENITEKDIDQFSKEFSRRYKRKKRINALLCLFIAFSGFSAVLYSKYVFGNLIIDRLRYMTFWGTIFTSIVSLIFAIVCTMEGVTETEVTYKPVYFLRLSSATTEALIFILVIIALTPAIPDTPDITSYPGFIMHFVVPSATVLSFVLNDPPFGKPNKVEPLRGTVFIGIYATVMTILFGGGLLPSDEAPYFFLNFDHTSRGFRITFLIIIFVLSYGISRGLMKLNMKLSWIWFYNIRKKRGEKN